MPKRGARHWRMQHPADPGNCGRGAAGKLDSNGVFSPNIIQTPNGKVYIYFEDKNAQEEALKQPDCRRLTSAEGRELEETFPFPIASPGQQHVDENQPVGLGDAVAWLASRLGIEECEPCRKRKRWLNKVVVWGWWRRPSS